MENRIPWGVAAAAKNTGVPEHLVLSLCALLNVDSSLLSSEKDVRNVLFFKLTKLARKLEIELGVAPSDPQTRPDLAPRLAKLMDEHHSRWGRQAWFPEGLDLEWQLKLLLMARRRDQHLCEGSALIDLLWSERFHHELPACKTYADKVLLVTRALDQGSSALDPQQM